MAFHSLENQTFRGRQDREIQSKRKTVMKGGKKKCTVGSRRHQDIGEVQIKNEKRDRRRGEERVMEVDRSGDTRRYVMAR